MNTSNVIAQRQGQASRIDVLGLGLHPYALSEVRRIATDWLAVGTRFRITVVNVHSMMMAQKDLELKECLLESELLLSDSVPICWLSRALGSPLPGRLAGPDLCEGLLSLAEEKKYRLFFLGSSPEVLEKISDALKRRFPSMPDIGVYSPPMRQVFSQEENAEMIEAIHQAKPDIVFVGMTAGKHEKWIAHNFARLDCQLIMGIGATFDFLAGTVKRAPLWMRRAGLEWFYRLCQEPRRMWKRYAYYNALFVMYSCRAIVCSRVTRFLKFA